MWTTIARWASAPLLIASVGAIGFTGIWALTELGLPAPFSLLLPIPVAFVGGLLTTGVWLRLTTGARLAPERPSAGR